MRHQTNTAAKAADADFSLEAVPQSARKGFWNMQRKRPRRQAGQKSLQKGQDCLPRKGTGSQRGFLQV